MKIAILHQFLAMEPHFVRKGCTGRFANCNFTAVFRDRTSFRAKGLRPDALQIAILLQFFGDRTSFRAKGLRFLPARWHCPAPSREK